MNYIKITKNQQGFYSHSIGSNGEMEILGMFLTDDVGCFWPSYIEFAFDENFSAGCGNATCIEKDEGYIYLSDALFDLKQQGLEQVKLKITREQYISLLETWRDTVCKLRPSEVIIHYDHDQFIFEIKE